MKYNQNKSKLFKNSKPVYDARSRAAGAEAEDRQEAWLEELKKQRKEAELKEKN